MRPMVTLFLLLSALGSQSAVAATLVVDTTSDNGSAPFQACTAAPGDCSLRGALARAQDAALQPGDDLIHFDIPAATDPGCVAATGVCTITLASSITAAMTTIAQGGLTVDGTTQPGASANTLPAGQGSNAVWKIELAGAAHTLGFQAPITIRGIAFRTGLLIQRVGGFCCGTPPGSGRYEIEGNAFGLLADGETPSPSPPGILLHLPVGSGNIDGARIGGGLPEQRNVFGSSGDVSAAGECLRLSGTSHVVLGNLIGADRSGTQARGCRTGILLDGSGIDIGGSGSGEGNLFAGHFNHALQINGSQPAGELKARIRGNSFGVAVDGVSPLPIGTNGVFSADLPTIRGDNGASQVRIGGVAPGEGNLFANSGLGRPPAPSTPPHVQTSVTFRIGRWEVLGNRFVGNRGVGIDSTANGAGHRPNDAGDGDSSTGSKLQNFPVISASSLAGNQLDLTYSIDSAFAAVPAEGQSTYPLRVEFYKADGAAGSVLLGHDTYGSAEAQTSKSIKLTLPSGVSLSPDEVIVATATDSATVAGEPTASITGNTSEFSFYPLAGFSFVSLTPAVGPAGSAYTARVRLVAAAGVPFKPTGEVLIQDGRGGECIAQVLPVAAASTGEGECQLTTGGAPGNVTVTASYNSALNAFALPSGASPANVSLTRTLREALVVDTTSDSAAAAFQACTAAPGDCSLRGALIKAQRDLAGEDSIHFDIPASDPACDGTGVCTITLSTDSIDLANLVPGIQTGPNQGFTIDGYTQPGASANTLPLGQGTNAQLKIKLVGPVGTARQIMTHSPFTIRGLIFQNIALMHQRGDGGSGGNGHPADLRYQLYGNFFGIDADGTTGLDSPSLAGSSYVRTSNLIRGVRIGSGDPADSNLFGAGAQKPNFCLIILGENRVQGNFIGTDRSGISGSGCQNGLQVSHQASPNRLPLDIGGSMPGQGNVIANHVGYAIDVIPTERDVLLRIRGNKIGIGVDGLTPAPNINFGSSACTPFAAIRGGFAQPGSAQIGGLAPGEGNLFGPNGVNRARCPAPFAAPAPYMQTVAAGEGMGVWQVQGNRYVGLEGMAIDLVQTNDPNNSQPQRLPNDAGDADPLGANRRQNFPTISAFGLAGNQVSLTYQVDSTPANSRYPLSIEFLKDDGQGNLTPIGHDTYTAGEAQTDKAIGFTLPAGVTLGSSDIVIATATTTGDTTPGENISGETSETSFYPLESFSLVSITPTTVPSGMPVTARVRAVAAAGVPFRPNGRVLVQASNGSSPFEECTALLAPVAAPRTSEGECQFSANAPPGNLGVRVSYDGARNSFALADGRHPPSVLQTITVRNPLVVDTTSNDGSAAFQACTAAPGDCSLRGALSKAFSDAGEDTIAFDIPMSDPGCVAATGVCTIDNSGGIGYGDHNATRGITIDGYTQPGASPNTLPVGQGTNAQIRIELAGGGFAFAAPFTVRGLAFLGPGIIAARADGVLDPAVPQQGNPRYQIHGNFFGFRADGLTPTVVSGQQQFLTMDLFRGEIRGIEIGGPDPAQMNVFGGSGTTFCIQLRGNGHRVRGNLIGTDRSGMVAHSCGFQAGIQVGDFAFPSLATDPAAPHRIGGLAPGEGNVISGLRGHAIANDSGAQQGLVIVEGNRIGVAVDGQTRLPNITYQDIFPVPTGAIRGDNRPTSMRIEGNLFGPNGLTRGRVPATPPFVQTPVLGQSVGVWESRGNRYRGLQGLAVDLVSSPNDNPPRTPNDPGDPDQLQNILPFTHRAQNFPEISAFALSGDQLTLSYRVDSLPANSAYPLTVEFYRDNGRGDLDPIGSDLYLEAQAQQVKEVVLTLPPGLTLGAADVVVGMASTSVVAPNRSGETSESSFYPLETFSFVSLTPATVAAGQPYVARVRLVAAPGAPFKPNGRVLIQDGRGSECVAFVAPVAAARTGEGECELTTTGAPGSVHVVASYSASMNAFAPASGAHPANVSQTLTLREPLVVDTTSDEGSAAFQACTAAPGDCSLRGAIIKANLDAAADSIQFDIPMGDGGCTSGTGVCRIAPQSALPTIGQPLTIDGYSQAGASPNTVPAPGALDSVLKIEIDGTGVAAAVPAILNVSGAPVTLRGLAIGGVPSNNGTHAVNFGFASGGSRIEGCYLGTDASGSVALPAAIGVRAEGTVFIGGDTPAARNLISGNRAQGVVLGDGVTTTAGGSIVQGNLIGTTRDGLTALANGLQGIRVFAPCSAPFPLIGGIGAGNRIAGNHEFGLRWDGLGICSADGGGQVIGNVFGQAVDGSALGNRLGAIVVAAQGGGVDIGRLDAGAGNVIAHSTGAPGHGISSSRRFVRASGNRWFGNAGLAINGPIAAGRDPNDAGDADFLGTSRAQNAPAISAFSQNGNELSLSYRVDSEFDANAAATNGKSVYPITVDFYRAAGDEGEVWLGSDVYAAGEAQTVKPLTLTLPSGVSFGANDVLIATATDSQGNQSEFNFYLIDSLAILSDEPDPTPAGVPYTVTVRAEAAAGQLFAPNGQVRINDGRGGECLATLAPTATPLRAEGSCELSSTGAPGTLTLTASLSAQDSAFALANGASVANATATHTLLAGVTALELVSGNNQSAPLGEAFGEALVVRTLGSGGAPVAGIPIQFNGPTTGAGASFEPQAPVSGADGLASTTATAIRAGGSYTVTARVGVLTQTFELSNEPGLDTALQILSNLPNPSNPGQAVTVTTALNPEAGGPAPTGAIAVTANTGEACSIVLPATSCQLSFATLGERVIQAFYPGDASYLSSKAAFATHQVVPQPSLRIDDVSQAEGNSGGTDFVFSVTLENPSGGPVSVAYATVDDSATAPGDYAAVSGTLNFSGATTVQTITVVVAGDEDIEQDERFFVELGNAAGAVIVDGQGIGTIVNDDQPQPPRVSIDDVTVQEPVSSGLTQVVARFRLHLNRPAEGPAVVRARSIEGSATGADYDGVDQRIEFAPGQRERFLEVHVRDDLLAESPETFTIELSEAQGITIADGSATGTILDGTAGAALVVNSSADPGDGICNSTECTLREAINTGNTLESVAIAFAIPGAGPHTIRPLTPLPIPGPAIHTIDGYTQPNSRPNSVAAPTARMDADLRIALDGSALGTSVTGLTALHGMTIRGLAMHGWGHAAVMAIANSTRPTRIVGNYLGTGVDGVVARGNGHGVDLRTDGTQPAAAVDLLVGGDGPDRNLISGNTRDGVVVLSGNVPATRVRIADNLIGLAADGSALGNAGRGISLSRPNVLIEGNVIAANGDSGIVLTAPARILRNLIGTDAERRALGNGSAGVSIGGSVTTVIGGEVRGNDIGPHPQGGVRIVRVIGGGQQSRVPVVPAVIATASTPIDFGSGTGGPNEDLPAPQITQQGFNDRGDRLRVSFQIPAAPVAGRPLSAHFYAVEDGRLRLLGVHAYGGGTQTSELALDRPLRAGARLRALSERAGSPPVSSVLGPEGPVLQARQALAAAEPRREGQGQITFTIRLDPAPTAPVTLDYRTVDGSALAGAHYQARRGSVTLAPAQPSALVQVPLIDNVLVDGNREFTLEVHSVADFSIGSAIGVGSILDDESLRPDNNPADTLVLDDLDGTRGFRIEHGRDPEVSLADLGDFDGNGRRDLVLARSGGAATSDNPGSVQLLMNLPATPPGLLQLPATGSAEFPLIVDDGALGAAFRVLGLPNLRGPGARGSMLLRSGSNALVLYGRSTALPPVSNLASLASGADAQLLSAGQTVGRVVGLGDINGDGREDFGVLAGGIARVYFGQPVGTPLPSTLNGSNGFTIRGAVTGPGAVVDVAAIDRGVAGGFQASLLVRVQSGPASCLFRQIVRPGFGQPWPATVFANEFPLLEGGNSPRAAYCGPVEIVSGRLTSAASGTLVLAYPEIVGTPAVAAVQLWSGSPGGLSLVGRILPAFPGDRLGQGLALLPDFDGDGRNDLAVGVAGADAPETAAGQVLILRGIADASFGDVDLANPPAGRVRFLSARAGGRAGWRLAALGDFNGDGRGELGITAPRLGRSYVVYSDDTIHRASSEARPPPRPAGRVLEVFDGGNQITLPPSPVVPRFEILPSGDVDGNGRADVLIGDPGGTAYSLGAIVSADGQALSTSGLSLLNLPSGPGYTRWAISSGDVSLGAPYAVGGDFDGDGIDDLAFHDRNQRLAIVHGRDRLLGGFRNPFRQRGLEANLPDDPRTRWIQIGGVLRMAWLGDVDGDGFDDLGLLRSVAGGHRTIEIVYGNAGGEPRRTTITAPADMQPIHLSRQPGLGRIRGGAVPADSFEVATGSGARAVVFGGTLPGTLDLGVLGSGGTILVADHWRRPEDALVVGLGDLDGDGLDDFGVAHASPSADGAPQGRVELLRGRSSYPAQIDMASQDAAQIQGRILLRGLGASRISALDSLGDRNADGRRELLIVLPDAEGHAERSGVAMVLYGFALPAGVQTQRTVADLVDPGAGLTIRNARFSGLRMVHGRVLGDLDGDGLDDLGFSVNPEQPEAAGVAAHFILRGSALDL